MKTKTKTKKIVSSLLLGLFFSFFCFQTVSAEFNYKLLETFPGFFAAGDSAPSLPEMILAIYKFGIWTVGIAGLFMLVVGGFMYMASAGNTSTAGSARKIISDALLGIVAALGAYLIMYVINPDLTKIDFTNFVAVDVTETEGTPMGPNGTGIATPYTKTTPGACAQKTSGDCSATNPNMIATFGQNAGKASSICNGESGGKSDLVSGFDKCSDGGAFSVGLFQINMVDSATSIGCNKKGEIFSTGNSKGTCLQRDAKKICRKWSCTVKNTAAYNACVAKLKDPATNMTAAKSISKNGSTWTRWGANKDFGCFFP